MNPPTTLQKINELRRHYDEDTYVEALPLLKEMLDQVPHDGQAWFGLGYAYVELADYANARHAVEQAIRYGSREPRWFVYYQYAEILAFLGETDAALDWLEKAVKAGMFPRARAMNDKGFDGLHDHPRFRELCGFLPTCEFTRDEGWRYDLEYLVAEMLRLHPNAHKIVDSEHFQTAYQTLYTAIPTLSDALITARIETLLVLLGDGHSHLYPLSTPLVKFMILPVQFYWFGSALTIVKSEDAALRGAKVLKIGEVSIETIRTRLPEFIPHDNPNTILWVSPLFLRLPLFLHYLGATDSLDSATFTLAMPDGTEQTVAFSANGKEFTFDDFAKLEALNEDSPLFLQHVAENFRITPFPDHQALYVLYNQVRNTEEESVQEFAGRVARALQEHQAKRVILDVRQNNGGNNFLNKPLVQALIHFEQSSPDHRIFVIAGRSTFSACQNFINLLDRFTNAIFVGEASGSSINFIGESTNLLLPYSQLQGSISCYLWQDSHSWDHRIWVTPHIPVEYTAEDYFGGHDPALAAIWRVLGE